MSRVLCRIPALISVIILMMTIVSCAGKEEVPSPEPVPSQTEETDDISGTGGNDEGSPSEQQTAEKVSSLKHILESLDEKRKNGITAAQEKLEVPGRRSMIIPLESMQFVSRGFDEESHHGIDFVAMNGTEVYAAFGGFVADTGFDEEFGNYMLVEHGGGIMTVYSHLQDIAAETGAYVETGDLIGHVGASGNATGPHLDLRVLDNGAEVDPEPFLNSQLQK